MMQSADQAFETAALVPGFVAPELLDDFCAAAVVEAADRRATGSARTSVRSRRGRKSTKREVCRMFRETFNPDKPSVINWPTPSAEARRHVSSLPIWDIAVQTEGKARLRMAACTHCIDD